MLTGRSEQKYSPGKRRAWTTPWCAHHSFTRSCGYVETTPSVVFQQSCLLEKCKNASFIYNHSEYDIVCMVLYVLLYISYIIIKIEISKSGFVRTFRFLQLKKKHKTHSRKVKTAGIASKNYEDILLRRIDDPKLIDTPS